MSWSWLLTNFIAAFLLPPVSLLIIGAVGLYLLRRKKLAGKTLIAVSLLGTLTLSTPWISNRFLDSLNPPYHPLKAEQADAIVILGGGSDKDVLEYGGDTVNATSLERIRYGAHLARKFNKPILITGGSPTGGRRPEAALMAEAMTHEFGTPVRWIEDHSETTYDNARFSGPILKEHGIHRIFLVTHAWHLKRAIPQFEQAGLEVIPAGFGYMPEGRFKWIDLLPNAIALMDSYHAAHEWIGVLWYRIRNLME